MATTEFGTGNLILNKQAHNYYRDERVDTLDGQSVIYVSSVAPPRQYPGMKIPMPSVRKTAPVTELETNIFLTVLVDKDKDAVIDNEEYQYIILEF